MMFRYWIVVGNDGHHHSDRESSSGDNEFPVNVALIVDIEECSVNLHFPPSSCQNKLKKIEKKRYSAEICLVRSRVHKNRGMPITSTIYSISKTIINNI